MGSEQGTGDRGEVIIGFSPRSPEVILLLFSQNRTDGSLIARVEKRMLLSEEQERGVERERGVESRASTDV